MLKKKRKAQKSIERLMYPANKSLRLAVKCKKTINEVVDDTPWIVDYIQKNVCDLESINHKIHFRVESYPAKELEEIFARCLKKKLLSALEERSTWNTNIFKTTIRIEKNIVTWIDSLELEFTSYWMGEIYEN